MVDVIRLLSNKYRARGFLWMLNNLNVMVFCRKYHRVYGKT